MYHVGEDMLEHHRCGITITMILPRMQFRHSYNPLCLNSQGDACVCVGVVGQIFINLPV